MILQRPMYYPSANEDRLLHIYVPDDYADTSERYPVMYFFDGHNLFFNEEATYGTCWGLKDFPDTWNKRMIVVGMECSHVNQERLSEYCPYDKHFFGKTLHGKGKETFDWIIHEIKPMIDRDYRTWSHREATGIAGSSEPASPFWIFTDFHLRRRSSAKTTRSWVGTYIPIFI